MAVPRLRRVDLRDLRSVNPSHRTTAIKRPDAASSSLKVTTVRRSHNDLTTSVLRDRRLLPAAIRPLAWFAGTVVMVAVIVALFVIPVRNWLDQDDTIAEKRAELEVLQNANAQLESANARLQTDDGVREAAREEIGYVVPGEERLTVMPLPSAPLSLPTGWPYDTISQIIAVRSTPPPPVVESTVASTPGPATEPAPVPLP